MRSIHPKIRPPLASVPALPPVPEVPAAPIVGRTGETWFSAEFLLWCQRHHFKPEGIASCILHTMALETGDNEIVVRRDGQPVSVESIYDLGDASEGKGGA